MSQLVQQTADEFQSIRSTIQGKSGLTFKDGQGMQGFRGNIRQVGTDQIEVTFRCQRNNMSG